MTKSRKDDRDKRASLGDTNDMKSTSVGALRHLDELDDFEIAEGNRATVGELCRILEGIPLAVSLAAVWLRTLSPEPILALLDDRFLPLIGVKGKILKGDPVNIIQHPEGGPKRYATVNNRLLDLRDDGFLLYETDTLEGSSGSPVFNQHW